MKKFKDLIRSKKFLIISCLLILMVGIFTFVNKMTFSEETADKYECFTYEVDGEFVTITDYDSTCSKDVVIPSKIENKQVTTIGIHAFEEKGLKSVLIPEGVTTINKYAFMDNDIAVVNLPDSLMTIDSFAFYSNDLSNVVIDGNVTTIKDMAFGSAINDNGSNNQNLDVIVNRTGREFDWETIFNGEEVDWEGNIIPSPGFETGSVKVYGVRDVSIINGEVEDNCFITENNNNELTITGYYRDKCPLYVVIPSEIGGIPVVSIGENAFDSLGIDEKIYGVEIPDSVVNIGDRAFFDNEISNLKIGNGVVNIGNSAFADNLLMRVLLPNSVNKIVSGAFAINMLDSVNIPDSVDTIGDSAFANNRLTNVNIPNSVTSIENGAFNSNQLPDEQAFIYKRNSNGTEDKTIVVSYGGKSRDFVEIPDGVTTIAKSSFANNQIISVAFPNSLRVIESVAFVDNDISTIYLNEGLESIGESAFLTNKLRDVEIPSTVTNIGKTAFGSYNISGETSNSALIEIVNGTGKKFNWVDIVTGNTTGETEDIFDYGVVKISNENRNVNINSIELENDCFYYRILGERVSVTGYNNDSTCSRDLVIPSFIDNKPVTSIGEYAFNKHDLTSIEIPTSVVNIGDGAFTDNQLEDGQAFIYKRNSDGTEDKTTIVSYGGKNRDNVIIPDGVKVIGSNSFGLCKIKNIQLPDGLTDIEGFALADNLFTSIELPSSLKNIGDYSLAMNKLTYLEIPGNVDKIGRAAIYMNSDLDLIRNTANKSFDWDSILNDMDTKLYTFIYGEVETERDKFVSVSPAVTDGSCFTYEENNNELTITGYSDSCTKNLVIPSKISDKQVVNISSQSFYNKNLKFLEIPNTVKEIGDMAFFVNYLDVINIPGNVQKVGIMSFAGNFASVIRLGNGLKEIGKNAFLGNGITDLVIPSSVISIEEGAFLDNKLTNITIPNSVTFIGVEAFNSNQLEDSQAFIYKRNSDGTDDKTTIVSYGGKKRENIVVPNDVKIIGERAFRVGDIKSISLPEGLLVIEKGAFSSAELSTITLPDSLMTIGEEAFIGNNLTGKIEIPSNVTAIGQKAFLVQEKDNDGNGESNIELTEIVNKTGNIFNWGTILDRTDTDEYTFNYGTVKTVDNKSIKISSGKIEVDKPVCNSDLVYNGNSQLLIQENEGYTISDNSQIDAGDYLLVVKLNDGYLWKDYSASDYSLTCKIEKVQPDITISVDNNEIEKDETTKLKISSSIDGTYELVVSPSSLLKIDNLTGSLTKGEEKVIDVQGISVGTSQITYKFIPSDNTNYVGSSKNVSLTILEPEPVVKLEPKFDVIIDKESLMLGDNATLTITSDVAGVMAVGSSDTNILILGALEYNIVENQEKTVLVNSKGIGEGSLSINFIPTDSEKYSSVSKTINIEVVKNCFEYEIIDNEITITEYDYNCSVDVVIPDKIGGKLVTTIGEKAFFNREITSVIIPNTVTTIGDSAFMFNNLETINIPNSVDSIGIMSFSLNSLEEVHLGNGINEIGKHAFLSNLLTELVVPNSVKTIGEGAFMDNKLTNITIPNSVISIEKEAFNVNLLPDSQAFIYKRNSDGTEDKTTIVSYGGENIDNVVIPAGVKVIGDGSFRLNDIKNIQIPEGITSILDNAFSSNSLTTVKLPNSLVLIGKESFSRNNLTGIIKIPNGVTSIGEKAFLVQEKDSDGNGESNSGLTEIVNGTGKEFNWGIIIDRVVDENYIFNYGTVTTADNKMIKVTSGKVQVEKPICNNGLIYNGNSQLLVKENAGYTISENSQINAGSYPLTIKLNSGYIWKDNSVIDYSLTCKIEKQDIVLNVSEVEILDVNVSQSKIFKISANVSGKYELVVNDTSLFKLDTYNGNLNKGEEKVITITALKEGATVVDYKFIPDNSNYNNNTKTIAVSAINENLEKVTPSLELTLSNKTIVIGKNATIGIKVSVDGIVTLGSSSNSIVSVLNENTYDVKSNVLTDVLVKGNGIGKTDIKVTFTPTDIEKYESIIKTISIEVIKDSSNSSSSNSSSSSSSSSSSNKPNTLEPGLNISISSSSVRVDGESTLMFEPSVSGTLKLFNENDNIVLSNNEYKLDSKDIVTIKIAGKKEGKTSLTLEFIPDDEKYNKVTKTYEINVIKKGNSNTGVDSNGNVTNNPQTGISPLIIIALIISVLGIGYLCWYFIYYKKKQ